MKGIFFCLVTLNVVFLAYLIFSQPQFNEPKPEVHEEFNIQLTSEREGLLIRSLEAKDVLGNPIMRLIKKEGSDCKGLGPFESIDSAQDIAERLNAAGYEVRVRAVDRATKAFDYRVIIPPFVTVQEAYRRLRELKSQDIDSYVMSQGEDSLAISLGVYPTKKAAVEHRLSLAEEGYNVEIREIPRFVRAYWVFLDSIVGFPSEEIVEAGSSDIVAEWVETACLN